ncbi:efflux RND transporter periplasmic adaptor subunit [Methylobacterium durans]|uniref:efflux RND transporter periplasmic adaptor subunit n=1 Tax=Methylobacterium durans TaxID=2202825 RepID=UPI002AFDF4D0|nr:efflux RND transporter periplasmic adaptor subunit [Methylobacterium durans]MEA1831393.1 efflux RND transporter periplasmic adaptor subunit [Methylobacterium durans]
MSERLAAEVPSASQADGRLSILEPALWQRLQTAVTLAEAAQAWLTLQVRMLPAASGGCVLAPRDLAPLAVAGAGPEGLLHEAAATALRENRPVVHETEDGPSRAAIALPLLADGAAFAVAAFAVETRDRDELRGAIRQVQWGAAWLVAKQGEAIGRRDRQGLARSRAALDLLAGVLEQSRFRGACMAAVTDLAITFSCQRVAIGFMRRGVARVAGISHSAQFGREMNLVRRLGACMNEAVDQRSLILFPPPPGEVFVTTAHADLARLQHDGRVLTVPLLVDDRFVGAVTLERPGDQPFLSETVELIAATCAAIGPVLEEKRQNDRWLAVKAADSAAGLVRRIVGPNRTGLKLGLAALVAAVAALSLIQADYRVTADARVEGLVRRSVVASYDGYLKAAQVRAGDTVRKGDLLATLEDRDLALERLRWVTERQQRTYEYDKALATRQPATINVVKSQIDQADAQIRLIDEQLARAKFTAPFDGLIVSGDLSQAIGGAISRGQVLFEIAPLDAYRVVLSVDERLIADLREGQTGQMLASSLPDQPQALTIQTITPVAEARNGRNLFRVEGRITDGSTRLRPGMEGIAKVDVDRRLLAWVWARPVVDWARLALWHWWP